MANTRIFSECAKKQLKTFSFNHFLTEEIFFILFLYLVFYASLIKITSILESFNSRNFYSCLKAELFSVIMFNKLITILEKCHLKIIIYPFIIIKILKN